MRTTEHGQERARQRAGIKRSSVDKMAKRAWEEGFAFWQTYGGLRQWMEDRTTPESCVRIYGEFAYIFGTQTVQLITILNVPKEFKRQLEKIRNK